MGRTKLNIPNKTAGYNGSVVAVAAVLAYSMLVMVYAIFRSSATIYIIMPIEQRDRILSLNGFSVAYSVTVFSLLMAAPSSVGGFITAVILKNLLLYFNPQYNLRKAIFISGITALVLLTLMYIFFYALLKDKMTFNYAETLVFWFVFPGTIFFAICIIAGCKFNKRLNQTKLTNLALQIQ